MITETLPLPIQADDEPPNRTEDLTPAVTCSRRSSTVRWHGGEKLPQERQPTSAPPTIDLERKLHRKSRICKINQLHSSMSGMSASKGQALLERSTPDILAPYGDIVDTAGARSRAAGTSAMWVFADQSKASASDLLLDAGSTLATEIEKPG